MQFKSSRLRKKRLGIAHVISTILFLAAILISIAVTNLIETIIGRNTDIEINSRDATLGFEPISKMHRDYDHQIKFPCHYMTNRRNEYNIMPHYDKRGIYLPFGSKHDISIVTMMSPSDAMFSRLLEMINRWSGPISVSVFIDDAASTEHVELSIQQFKKDNAAALLGQDSHDNYNGNRVSFHLVTDLDTNRGTDVNMFPRNLLRNVALDNAMTDYVLVLDVDFATSIRAHENLKRHLVEVEKEMESSDTKKYALVVPAFEKFEKGDTFLQNQVETKEEMIAMKEIDPGVVLPFMKREKFEAHGATDSQKWYRENKPYLVDYEEDYEPYVVVHKNTNLPPFWEHFTGFGRNKLQWIEELYISGFQFIVVPDTFVLHKSHKEYGLRKLRPFIADEYVSRFQKYLGKTYGKTMRAVEPLKWWQNMTYSKWERKVVKTGRTTVYTTMEKMAELSERREAEFEACLY